MDGLEQLFTESPGICCGISYYIPINKGKGLGEYRGW